MPKPDETNNETFESRMGGNQKKIRRRSIGVIAMLLLLGLLVGGWFAFDEWLESGKALSAAIKGTVWVVASGVMAAATTASLSRRCGGDCWLKKLYHRVKRQLTSSHETPWHQR